MACRCYCIDDPLSLILDLDLLLLQGSEAGDIVGSPCIRAVSLDFVLQAPNNILDSRRTKDSLFQPREQLGFEPI
jgi:hypothetical protein